MKDIAKIFAYLAGVILLGAILAPPLYWGAQWLVSHGIFPALAEFKFQKYFNRAALISALLLLWPVIRWLRVGSWRDLGVEPDPRWKQHLAAGFLISGLAVAAMAFVYVQMGIYRMRDVIAWGKVPVVLLSAVTVAFLEEALFRGAILGLVRRSMGRYASLFWVTVLFAIVHFLKPDDSFDVTNVGWLSGFELIPHTFHQFAEPMALAAGFTTLFALGWLCGDAAQRTRALWLSIGIHAGIVFVKMSFSVMAKFAIKTKHRDSYLPWVDDQFETGLVPVGVLLLTWLVILLWLAYEIADALRLVGDGLLSLLYPPHCAQCGVDTVSGVHLCADCARQAPRIEAPFCRQCSQPFDGKIEGEFVCAQCRDRQFHFECAVTRYLSRGVVREFIHRFKYDRHFYLRHPLATWMAEALDDPRIKSQPFDAFVPVPLHSTRYRERDFNQAEVLAKIIAKRSGKPILNALKRIRYTTTQTKLDREERMENLRNAFRVRHASSVQGRHLILVDDVFTTGSTVEECSRVLCEAGAASVRVLTVARG